MTPSLRIHILAVLSFSLCWIGGTPSALAKTEATCSALAKAKKYAEAGGCFEGLANKEKRKGPLSKIQKKLKASLLQAAANAYQNEAKGKKDLGKKSYWQEKSLRMLEQLLREKLCLKSYRCRGIRGRAAGLKTQIAYKTLTLVATTPVKALVSGYKYEKELDLTKTQVLFVRPGQYKVTRKTMPKKVWELDLSVKGGQVTLSEAAPSPSLLGPSLVVGGSIALLVAGGIFLGSGYKKLGDADDMAIQLLAGKGDKAKQAPQIDSLTTEGNGLLRLGWIFAGVGAVGTVSGVIWLLSRKKKSSPPPPSTKTVGKSTLLPSSPSFLIYESDISR